MKKITILALHLSTGGVEKSIATLSNMLAKKYEVEIIANYKIQEEPAFKIDNKVKIKYLMSNLKPNGKEFKQALKSFKICKAFKEGIKAIKILYLRKHLMIKEIKNLSCDVAISTRYLYNNILGKYAKPGIIKIAQEHNDGDKKYVKKIVKSLKNIDYFMPVSKYLTNRYSELLKEKHTKCIYIPHSLSNYTNEVSNLENKNIISVGRLSKEKGFLDLIDVFELVNNEKPEWHLNIVGDGEQRQEIQDKIYEKNLDKSITLVGLKTEEELRKLYIQSSIYVMTSYRESFGLVLIEAESFGIPLAAFDSASGACEIIQNESNGYLISNRDKEEMANKIICLINDEDLRRKIGQTAREDSEKYKTENIENEWFNFIDNIS
jgi:N-acetylglucosaminyldiphosphoundecaprenol N-acetyl-beta-D-mannosaminyltransferase